MRALVIVEAEPCANAGLGLADRRIGVEIYLLVFAAAPQPFDEDVVHVAALVRSMLIITPCRFRVPVNSSLVNWLPPAFAGAGSGRY